MIAEVRAVTCGFCRHEFAEDRGQVTCQRCPLSTGCRHVRCPQCGYENPVAPAWMRHLTEWARRAPQGASS